MSYNTEEDCAMDIALSKLFEEHVTISDEDKNKNETTISDEDKNKNETSTTEDVKVKSYTRKAKNTPQIKKNPLRVAKNGKVSLLFLVSLLSRDLITEDEFRSAKEDLYKGKYH
jgi:hypothetical protein